LIVEDIVRPVFFLWIPLLLCASLAVSTYAQEEFFTEEGLLESEEDDFDPQEVLERLAELRRRPLDPNRASFSQLQQIPYLTAFQVKGILDGRKMRKFNKLEDLLQVQGMDQATLARVRPFLRVRPIPKRWGHLRSRMTLRMPQARGYREGLYRGDPAKIYLRVDLSVNEYLSLGALSEKDPGEREVTDYRSFYVQLEHIGPLRRVMVGNFGGEFGQGLVLWTSGGVSGAARLSSTMKLAGRGIRPYTSTDENLGLYGIALAGTLGIMDISMFFSRARLDADVEGDEARSLSSSGFHRTEGEMQKKDTLSETLVGGHLSALLSQNKVVGLTWYRTRYRPALRIPDLVRRRYAFRGERSEVLGGHFDLIFGSLNLFGEAAVNERSACGVILGLLLEGESLNSSLIWRHYPPNYDNPHSSALAAKEDQNESGMLLALTWNPLSGTRLELLVDQHHRPWRGYFLEMPSRGETITIQMVRKLGSRAILTLRHRERWEEVAGSYDGGMSKNFARHVRSRRLQLDWRASGGIEVRGRLEATRVSVETRNVAERGALLLAQIKISPSEVLSLRGLAVFFDAPSYDSRMYLCEVGPSGVARNAALFGRGSRALLWTRYKVMQGLEVSVKFCHIHYDDRRSLGDGLEEIEGNAKKEALVQLDWRW
jgi:hypothetical protein